MTREKPLLFSSYLETTHLVYSTFFFLSECCRSRYHLIEVLNYSLNFRWLCFCVVAWHLAHQASGKLGMRPPIFCSGATARVRYGMIWFTVVEDVRDISYECISVYAVCQLQ